MRKQCFKRVLSLVLALALMAALCPVIPTVAEAATTTDTCPCCGVPVSEIAWYSLSGDVSGDYIDSGDHYRLVDDSAYIDTWFSVYGEMTIDLNGHKFGGYDYRSIELNSTLHLMDLSQAGTGSLYAGVDVSGELNLYSGTIIGCGEYGAVRIYSGNTMNMYGGTVSNGTSYENGGNIHNDGTFNMYGGTISAGCAYENGGNIHNNGTVNISGGVITGGYADWYGGNICNYGTVNISGGAVTGGSAYQGSGNIDNNADLYFTGGVISGGTADFAAVLGNWGTIVMAGGTISADRDYYDLYLSNYSSTFVVYAGRWNGSLDLTPYLADCTCYTKDAQGYTVVNTGYEDGECTDCEYAQLVEAGLVQHVSGTHAYEPYEGVNKKCSVCGKIYVVPICPCCGVLTADINWIPCSASANVDFSQAGHYQLTEDYTLAQEYTITADVIIDLNGYTLRSASGNRAFTVKSGGSLTIVNTVAKTGSLIGGNITANGGTINVENGGTLILHSGRIAGGTTAANGGNIYSNGLVKLLGGTVEGGTALKGGNVFNYNKGEFLLEGGTITGGMTPGDNGNGGNIYTTGKMTIKRGTVENGTSGEHGGNIYCAGASVNAFYGGTISGGVISEGTKDIFGHGGNIYVTGKDTQFHFYGGTVTGGQNLSGGRGGNIVFNSGVQGYIYGGTIENGYSTENKGNNISVIGNYKETIYSALYILGGTFTSDKVNDFEKDDDHTIVIYSCRYNGINPNVITWIADCCCYSTDEAGYTIWNAGYAEGNCTDCLYDQARAAGQVEVIEGEHDYKHSINKYFVCNICNRRSLLEDVAALVNGKPYMNLSEAVDAADNGDVIQMCADATLDSLGLWNDETLDLNGYTLTVITLTAASGNIIDTSKKNTGKLICDGSMSINVYNQNLPVNYEGSIRFSPVDFTQWVETVDENTTKVKFYFTQRAAETILDDAIKAGSTQMLVLIQLTWTDQNGNSQEKLVEFSEGLLEKYAEKWDGRVFVATITGVANVSNLQATYRVVSYDAGGSLVSGQTITAPKYINEKLSWETINSYPIKTSDMTVEEMRQLCVDFMEFSKTYLWTPSESVDYIRNAAGSQDSMSQGTIYGGLPYVGVASGNVYRMMDYLNEFGIVDMQKAIPALGSADRLTMSDLKYFGSQCSQSVYWAWGRVMNSTNYRWTSSVVPNNDFIFLGDIQIPEITGWTAAYNTKMACADNGTAVMYEAYAQLQKADGMVNYIDTTGGNGAGHLVMVYQDAEVAYNDDGTINGANSYIYIIDQSQSWVDGTNDAGDVFKYKNNIAKQYTFQSLYNSGYIPFTFAEFLGTDDIELTEVSLVNGEATLISGTIVEEDRSYQTTASVNNLTWSQFMDSSVTSNYGIVDVYLIVYDNQGNEMYKHAVRTGYAGNMILDMEEVGDMVTTWETKALKSGRTYSAEIVVQLSTGERPTIWNGQLTYDK